MTPERWRHINTLLQEALDRSPAEREAFLDDACADDEASKREVQSLISLQQKATTFLEVPALDAAADLFGGDQAQSLAGQLIGQYKIVSLLGSGGMGEVYLAEDTRLDRKVAIKFLPLDLEADELARRRQIREAKAAAKLDHPNICAIHEVAEEAGHSFIVMQYIEGETLSSRIERGGMNLCESLDVVMQVIEALSLAHSHGIIHRDIKPQNVMITPRGQVKVLDFGLAKVVRLDGEKLVEHHRETPLSVSGVIVGTVPYMSPEQAKGAPVDARSDLFSVGVMLYECLAGKPAFAGNTPIETCAQVIHVDPPAPSEFNPGIPPQLDRVILKALAKAPEVRHQSAGELAEDLRAIRASLKPDESAATRPIPFKPLARRVGGLTSVASIARRPRVFVPVIVAALAALSTPLWWRPSPHRPPSDALFFYKEGTAALREGLYFKASKALEQTVKIDDQFALAHARLAEALTELDYTDRAKDELIRAEVLVPDRSRLPQLEGLYLEAVTKTVLRNFATAIESYQEIARRVAEDERANAYLELGRAYEKDDQIDKAKESYLEATRLAPQDAASFLRLGVLYAEQQDNASAAEAFDKAESLYQLLSNHEGAVEVLFQRGRFLNNRGLLAEARGQLEKALNQALTLENKHQQIRVLLELSRVASTDGETTLAQQYATKSINLAQASDLENLSTQGLIELGNAFLARGDYSEAEKYLQRALEFAQRNKGRRNEARALVELGHLRISLHDADQGLGYIKQALPFYEQGGYRRDASMAFYRFGSAYELKGDHEAALQAFGQSIQLARHVDDPSLLALAYRNIGIIFADQERYSEALNEFEESRKLYAASGNHFGVEKCLADLGNMQWRLGRYQEARAALNQATLRAERPDKENHWMLAKVGLINAHLILSERRFADAEIEAKRAFALNADNEHKVEAKYVQGLAQVLSGAKHQGRQTCEDAVEMARHANFQPLLPGALLALAEALLESSDLQGALTNATEAQSRFELAGQQESEWRAWLMAARAILQAGDPTKAREYATRAESVLSDLQRRWGAADYEDYLTRPDIRYYRKSLSQILAVN